MTGIYGYAVKKRQNTMNWVKKIDVHQSCFSCLISKPWFNLVSVTRIVYIISAARSLSIRTKQKSKWREIMGVVLIEHSITDENLSLWLGQKRLQMRSCFKVLFMFSLVPFPFFTLIVTTPLLWTLMETSGMMERHNSTKHRTIPGGIFSILLQNC